MMPHPLPFDEWLATVESLVSAALGRPWAIDDDSVDDWRELWEAGETPGQAAEVEIVEAEGEGAADEDGPAGDDAR